MKKMKSRIKLLAWVVVFCMFSAAGQRAESLNAEKEKPDAGVIEIKSDTLEMNNKLKMVTFSGDVKASNNEFSINCDKMVGYGIGGSGPRASTERPSRFDKIVATGHVVIHRAQGGVATAEKAVYFQKDEKIVLSGNPIVKRGNDIVNGGRIIIFTKEDRVVVEDPKGTFAPREEKGDI